MSENKLVSLLNEYNHEHIVLETGDRLQIKPITTGQMKAILQYEGQDDATVIDEILDDLIRGCVTTEGFDVRTLTLQDRFDLLIGIRKISKGTIYNFNINCPKCGVESIQAIDLDDLEVVPFPVDIDRKVSINNNLAISLDFIRRGHQMESTEIVEGMGKLNDNQRLSEIATYMYAFGITEISTSQSVVEGVTIKDKKEFLDSLSASVYEQLNDWYEKNNYGTKFQYTLTCKGNDKCDFEKVEDIPLTGFFF